MISGYRLMWLLVMFDLPVMTRQNRRDYRRFVDKLEDDGYTRVQYSVYVRPCATDENTLVHEARVIGWLPPLGEVRVLKFTDKQWGRMTVYRERRELAVEASPEQFAFFDEDGAVLLDEVDGPDVVKRERIEVAQQESDGPDSEPELVAAERRADYGAKGDLPARGARPAGAKSSTPRAKKGGAGKKRPPKPTTPSFDFFE